MRFVASAVVFRPLALAALASLATFGALGACSSSAATAPAVVDAGDLDAGADVTAPAPAVDPTGWTSTAELHEARALATATLLADGRVLVVGGEGTKREKRASVELFDPTTNTYAEAAALPEPRLHHTATLLASGEVLVAGGGAGSQIALPTGEETTASAVLYDPKTNAWRATGSMHAARAGHRATRLTDGRVLVVGGGDQVGYPCASSYRDCNVAASIGSAEIYDPATGVWTSTGALAAPRLAFTLDPTPAGIVAAGGAANNEGLESVEIYDVVSGAWRGGPKLRGQRLFHATAVVAGTLIVAGGKVANVAPITSVDLLDEDARAWSSGKALDEARTGASFLGLPSGKALLLAGADQLAGTYLADAALYDPVADSWSPIEPLAKARYGQAAVLLADGSVLVVGGRTSSSVLTLSERSH